jgi:hypothetical protein
VRYRDPEPVGSIYSPRRSGLVNGCPAGPGLLPRWPILAGREPSILETSTIAIVTYTYAAVRGLTADLVIRADEQNCLIPMGGFPCQIEASREGRAYLIDFMIHPPSRQARRPVDDAGDGRILSTGESLSNP